MALISTLTSTDLLGLPDGGKLYIGGYYANNDGGGGVFIYDASSEEAAVAGMVVSVPGVAGRLIRDYSGAVNVRWCGAKGDGTTADTAAAQAAIDVLTSGGSVIFPAGNYLLGTVYLNNDVTIEFNGCTITASGLNVFISYNGLSLETSSVRVRGSADFVGAATTNTFFDIQYSGAFDLWGDFTFTSWKQFAIRAGYATGPQRVRIGGRLKFSGDSTTTTNPNVAIYCIQVSERVEIDGVTVSECGNKTQNTGSIQVYDCNNVFIRGVDILERAQLVVKGCNFGHITDVHAKCTDVNADGIDLISCVGFRLTACEAYECYSVGIAIENTESSTADLLDVTLSNCSAHGNGGPGCTLGAGHGTEARLHVIGGNFYDNGVAGSANAEDNSGIRVEGYKCTVVGAACFDTGGGTQKYGLAEDLTTANASNGAYLIYANGNAVADYALNSGRYSTMGLLRWLGQDLQATARPSFQRVSVSESGTNDAYVTIDAADAVSLRGAIIRLETRGSLRWLVGKNSSAETGANAGSNFLIQSYDDAGTVIATPLAIERANSRVTIASRLRLQALPVSAAGLSAGEVWNDGGTLKIT